MSDDVKYEPVPKEKLHDYQQFHANRKEYEDVEPYQGGVAAEVLGIPAVAGAKTISGVLHSPITRAVTNKIAEKLAPENYIAKWQATQHIDPATGKPMPYQGGVDYGAEHQLQMQAKGQAAKQALINEVFPPELGEAASAEGAMAGERAPLNPYQRAIQKVQSLPGTSMASKIVGSPLVKGAGVAGSLWEGGENAVRLWNHLKHGQTGREFLDTAGLLSNVATVAPTPMSPWSNIAGAAASIPIGYFQRQLDEQDQPQNKSTCGLTTLD